MLLSVLLLLFSLGTLEKLFASPQSPPRLILILCDALTLDDLSDPNAPHLRSMAERGSIGLMNCNGLSHKTPLEAWMTLAKGEASRATPQEFEAKAGWYPLTFQGRGGEETVGAVLKKENRMVLCFGNSDTRSLQRPGTLFVMNAKGGGYGLLDATRPDPKAPFQKVDDPLRLWKLSFLEGADLVVLNLGDMTRLEESHRTLSKSDYSSLRVSALKRLNILLFLLMEQIQKEHLSTSILLVSAYPPGEPLSYTNYWHRLTPVVGWGSLFPEGLFDSRTTRTPGLVGNVDIAPTVLSLMEVPISLHTEGRPLRTVPAGDSRMRLSLLERKDYLCALNFQGLIALTAPLFLLCATLLVSALIAHRRQSSLFKWLSLGFLFTLNIPSALLLSPLLPPPTVWEYGLRILMWMGVLTIVVVILARLFRTSPQLLTLGINLLAISLDVITGQSLMKESMVTNAALVGVRYYGIGNEYLGVFLGYALMLGFGGLEARRLQKGLDSFDSVGRRVVVLFWLLCTILLSAPMWGANAGSLILCVVGFGVASLRLFERRVSWREIVILLVLGFGATFVLSALEARFAPANASHLGASLQAASGGRGAGYLGEIVVRKIRMNLMTLVTWWYALSILGVSFTAWAGWRIQKEAFARMVHQFSGLQKSLQPFTVFCVTALLFKDTGAMTVLFLGSGVYVILLWYTTQVSKE